MKRTRLLLLYSLLLVGFLALTVNPALAQDPTPDSTEAVQPGTVPIADAPATADAPADAEKDVTVEELTKAFEKAVEDWETLGWIGGMVAVIGVLVLLMRFKKLDKLLEDKGLKWIKPYIAVGLGILLGFFSTYASGKSLWFSIVMGLIAGVTSPGLHLLLTKGNK